MRAPGEREGGHGRTAAPAGRPGTDTPLCPARAAVGVGGAPAAHGCVPVALCGQTACAEKVHSLESVGASLKVASKDEVGFVCSWGFVCLFELEAQLVWEL